MDVNEVCVVHACVCVCVCVCACVCARTRMCVRARARACACVYACKSVVQVSPVVISFNRLTFSFQFS